MATVTENVNQTTEQTKPKFSFSVEYKSQDGSWKTATSEREFTIPEGITEVSVNIVGDDGKQEQVKREFRRRVVESQDDLLALISENPYLALAAANYGLDLYARNTVKAPIATEVEGPGKLLKKSADQIFNARQKMGKPVTMERAFELAKRSLEEE